MDDNKNVIIAVVLMLLVWVGFSMLYPSQPPSPPSPIETPATPAPVPNPGMSQAAVQPPAETPTLARDIVVETDLFRAVLTTAGARVKQFELKQYREKIEPASSPVQIVNSPDPRLATLRLTGTGDFVLPPDMLFSLQGEPTVLRLSGSEHGELVFRSASASGLAIERRYVFSADSYSFQVDTRVQNTSSSEKQGQLAMLQLHPWDDGAAKTQPEFVGSITLADDKVETEAPKDIRKETFNYGPTLWSGFKTKYFLAALIPGSSSFGKAQVAAGNGTLEVRMQTESRTLAPGETVELTAHAYFGPLDLDILKGAGHQLERAVDLGFFKILAMPLFHVLKFFSGFLGNYGLAIILLTVIIKILFWPLTQKSYTSMKAMQKLQPEMQKLREKFKNDRERMNREIMELYKNHRVNPMGGCLPMLVQIPVFFALYQLLMNAIEMRHAPFYLWIADLSAKDPYYITPVVMGATMFIQQKMTPTAGIDPIQAKIFLFLPLLFTVMFLNFPAGLVIYWLINNLLTILQQFLINRQHRTT